LEIKYSKKKQEIRKDPFLDFLSTAKEFVDKNTNTLIGAGVAFCLVLAGIWVYNFITKSNEEKAQEAFGRAMVSYNSKDEKKAIEDFKTVVDNYKNSPQASYSAFILGTIFLQGGKPDEAITWYKSAESKSTRTGFVGADALEGLASCYEAKGNREEALDCLKKAMEDGRVQFRFPALAWKATLLCKDLGRVSEAREYCRKILADTMVQAGAYRQKAENVLTELQILAKK
jgi:tetratricopeptide (TPR) repeat protein